MCVADDGACVACGIRGDHAGGDGFVCVGNEVSCGDGDGVVAGCVYATCEGLVVDRECDDVACFEFTRHTTNDGNGGLASFCGIDDVVGGNGIDRDRGGGSRRTCGVYSVWVVVGDGALVAVGIGGEQRSFDDIGGVACEIGFSNRNAEVACSVNCAFVACAVEGEGDFVASFEFARGFAFDVDAGGGVCAADEVVVSDSVKDEGSGSEVGAKGVNDIGVCSNDVAFVACAVCGVQGGVDFGVGVSGEVGDGDRDAVAAICEHCAEECFAIDGEGDFVARLEFTKGFAFDVCGCIGPVFSTNDDVVSGNAFDGECGRTCVGRCVVREVGVCGGNDASIACGIGHGDASGDGFVRVCQEVCCGNGNFVRTCDVYRTCEGFAVDGEGDDLACFEFARGFACDVGVAVGAGFCAADGVVSGDGVNAEGDVAHACADEDRCCVDGAGVARNVGEGDDDGVLPACEAVACVGARGDPLAVCAHYSGEGLAIDDEFDGGTWFTGAAECGLGVGGDVVACAAACVVGGVVRETASARGNGVNGEGGAINCGGAIRIGNFDFGCVGAVWQCIARRNFDGVVAVGIGNCGVGFAVDGDFNGGTRYGFAAVAGGFVVGNTVGIVAARVTVSR